MVINDYATHPHLSTISLFPQVNVTILDINDNAPLWRDEPYNANVVEMSPINTDVITVSRAPFKLLSASLHTSAQWGEGGGGCTGSDSSTNCVFVFLLGYQREYGG